MQKIIGLLAVTCLSVAAATLNVGVGETYTSLAAASTAHSAGDTILLVAASDSTFTGKVTLKADAVMMSDAGHFHTVSNPITSAITVITGGGDGFTVKDIKFIFESGTPSGFSYMIISNYDLHVIRCVFWNDNALTSNMRGVSIANAAIDTATFSQCVFRNLYNCIYGGTIASSGGKRVCIDNSLMLVGRLSFGTKWVINNTIITSGGENVVVDNSDSTTFNSVWFDQLNASNEMLTWDENTYKSVANIVKYCQFVNSGHEFLMWDYWWSSQCFNNVMVSEGSSDNNAYNHKGENPGTVDTVGYKCQFYNNTYYGSTSSNRAYVVGATDALDSINDCSFRRDLVLGLGGMSSNPQMARDTVDSMVSQGAITIGTDYSTINDTVYSVGSSYLIDTSIFFNHKRSSPYWWSGAKSYWFVPLDTSDITENGITWPCSLDVRFRHDNEIYDTARVVTATDTTFAFLLYNAWYAGDTATIHIDTSTDKSTWGSAVDSTFVAGESKDIVVGGLTAGTLYYIRQRALNSTLGLYDTSAIDSFTTTAAAGPIDTAEIVDMFPLAGTTAGGDTVDIISVGRTGTFGAAGTLNLGAVLTWNPMKVRFKTAAASAGATNIIVTPNGGEPDTIQFTYQDDGTPDSVFIDTTLLSSTTAYDPVTQSPTGGDYNAYPTLQDAVDGEDEGTFFWMRGQTHTGTAILRNIKGTSWVPGHYQQIKSWPDDAKMATFDGERNDWVCIGDTSTSAELYLVQHWYWIFDSLVVKNYTSVDSLKSSPFNLNHGPFIVRNCSFEDNYPMKNITSPNAAAVFGYFWKRCVIENCHFESNGGRAVDGPSHNCAQIVCFSDYRWTSTADSGYLGSEAYFVRAVFNNTIRYNLFNGDSYVGTKITKGGQYYESQNDTVPRTGYFSDWANDISYNIYQNMETAVLVTADYTQVHNNIMDTCSYNVATPDDATSYALFKVVVYNNTALNSSGPVAYFGYGKSVYDWTDSAYTTYHGYSYNNIADSCAWSTNDIRFVKLSAATCAACTSMVFDSAFLSNNLSFKSSDDPICFGTMDSTYTITEFNTLYGRDARHFTVASGALYASKYITNGTFVIATGGEDTTIADGGVNSAHPYLPDVTLPDYVGATDPDDNSWVGRGLALDSLGAEPTPTPLPVIDSIVFWVPRDSVYTDIGHRNDTATLHGQNIEKGKCLQNSTGTVEMDTVLVDVDNDSAVVIADPSSPPGLYFSRWVNTVANDTSATDGRKCYIRVPRNNDGDLTE